MAKYKATKNFDLVVDGEPTKAVKYGDVVELTEEQATANEGSVELIVDSA
jgi:hypothetical protein